MGLADSMLGSGGSSSVVLGQIQGINKNLSTIIDLLRSNFSPMTAHSGSFTLGAASSTVVSDTRVKSSSVIFIQDTNQAAATLQAGTNRHYVSVKSSGVSFTVAGTGSAAGTETFDYLIVNTG